MGGRGWDVLRMGVRSGGERKGWRGRRGGGVEVVTLDSIDQLPGRNQLDDDDEGAFSPLALPPPPALFPAAAELPPGALFPPVTAVVV